MLVAMLLAAASPVAIEPDRWLRFPDYPLSSIKRNEAGVVSYRLAVGSNGRATGCTVTESSGHAFLDRETCRILIQKARFEVGASANAEHMGSMAWSLPPERVFSNTTAATLSVSAVPPALTGPMLVKVSFNDQGMVAACVADNAADARLAVAICPALAGERVPTPLKAAAGATPMAVRYYRISLVSR